MDRPVILGIFAHPDDETFPVGGASCRHAAAGYDVVLISATCGEAGKAGDPPYPDKGVEHADPAEAVGTPSPGAPLGDLLSGLCAADAQRSDFL